MASRKARKRVRSPSAIAAAVFHASSVVAVGFILLGPFPAALFAVPFFGGLFMWLAVKDEPGFQKLKLPYFVTWAFFILHKIEERELGFFPKLAQLTGTTAPDENSLWVWVLYLLSAAWLLVPSTTSRGASLGYYLAWTFFLSMGVIELAHFVFPLMTGKPYAYFPGMATAGPLSAAGLWGVVRMTKANRRLARK